MGLIFLEIVAALVLIGLFTTAMWGLWVFLYRRTNNKVGGSE